ncbi:hypothetical protein [Streptomyces sp. B6B3]|uniref:hypothetical protein n=1 Tax=Streptomyces sp. B6B3 TaxID=3153570 RepID=UPI00325C56E8
MSGDGLHYFSDGFREAAQGSVSSADAAESTRRYLGRAAPNAASWAGADEFVNAVTATRDKQSQGVARAAEGRENMAASDHQVAGLGDELEVDADASLNAAHAAVGEAAAVDRSIADGM